MASYSTNNHYMPAIVERDGRVYHFEESKDARTGEIFVRCDLRRLNACAMVKVDEWQFMNSYINSMNTARDQYVDHLVDTLIRMVDQELEKRPWHRLLGPTNAQLQDHPSLQSAWDNYQVTARLLGLPQ